MKEIKEIADGQSFENIISDNQIYVDKTQDIYNLLKIKSRLFFSRPRRFGKSLVLDTIATLFGKGVEPYFKDTWIYDKWKEETYPVLRLNFIEYSNIDFQEFQNSFLGDIADFAQDLELKKFKLKSTISDTLKSLFKALVDRRIVILIDEYDAQLTANINNEELYNTLYTTMESITNPVSEFFDVKIKYLLDSEAVWVKHPSFGYEKEWRIVSPIYPQSQCYRLSSNNSFIPYVPIKIPINCLKRIVLGPCLDDSRLYDVKDYLKSKMINIEDICFSQSNVPLQNI